MTATLRADIQSLRGFAVLAVVLFHAKFRLFSAGYIGVDVFFVISGYLMTRLVIEAVDHGTFRFSEFYLRRAKRLLPALYVVCTGVAVAAPFVLASLERQWLRGQVLGGVTFTANVALARQSGYFDGEAELKPLLHLWSLSIEEQFYLLLPALVVVLPRRFRTAVLACGVMASYAWSQHRAGSVHAFYGLPSRAWELLLGALAAAWHSRVVESPRGELLRGRTARVLSTIALFVLVAAPLHQLPAPHPGPLAAIAGLATVVLLLVGSPALARVAPLRWLGDRSYSLYLVHWPLFAVFHNLWMAPRDTAPERLALGGVLMLSLGLTELLYRFVERPVHYAPWPVTWRVFGGFGVATAAVAALGFAVARVPDAAIDFATERQRNVGLAQACDASRVWAPQAACATSNTPTVLLWGDSFAMQWAEALRADSANPVSFVQATKSSCAPVLGVAELPFAGAPREWALECVASNDAVLSGLRQMPTVTTVVLASPFARLVSGRGRVLTRNADGTWREERPRVSLAFDGLRRTISAIRATGRHVVLIGPMPSSGVDVARCAERWVLGLPMLGANTECSIPLRERREPSATVGALLDSVSQRLGVPIVRPTDVLCDARQCRTMRDGWSLYLDATHLSYRGSAVVGRMLALGARVREAGR